MSSIVWMITVLAKKVEKNYKVHIKKQKESYLSQIHNLSTLYFTQTIKWECINHSDLSGYFCYIKKSTPAWRTMVDVIEMQNAHKLDQTR